MCIVDIECLDSRYSAAKVDKNLGSNNFKLINQHVHCEAPQGGSRLNESSKMQEMEKLLADLMKYGNLFIEPSYGQFDAINFPQIL